MELAGTRVLAHLHDERLAYRVLRHRLSFLLRLRVVVQGVRTGQAYSIDHAAAEPCSNCVPFVAADLRREGWYTRSRKLVALVGTLKALAIAVRNLNASKQVTMLEQRLEASDGDSAPLEHNARSDAEDA